MEMSEYIINLAAAIIAVEFMDHGFEKRFCGSRRWILFAFACASYFLSMELFNSFFSFEGLLGFCYGALLVGYGFCSLRGKWHEFVIMAIIWVFIAMTGSYLVYGALELFSGKDLKTILPLTEDQLFFAALVTLIVKFSMGRAATAFIGHRAGGFRHAEKWIVAGVFVLTTLLTMGSFVLQAADPSGTKGYWLTIGILIDEIFIVVFLVEMYRILGFYQERDLMHQYEERRSAEQKERIGELYRISREINHWRHDMLGVLGTMYQLQKNGKYEEVMSCIEDLHGKLKVYPELPQPTGNEGLDAALMKMIPLCKEKDIRFRYVVMGEPKWIDSMALGKLTDNLFANAAEACCKEGAAREIDLSLLAEPEKLEIFLKNGIADSVLKTNPSLFTEKDEKIKHGFGIKSILQIIENYCGTYEYWEEENEFCQKITLNCPSFSLPLNPSTSSVSPAG